MAPPTDRLQILKSLGKVIESGTAIVGAGAGKESNPLLNVHGRTG